MPGRRALRGGLNTFCWHVSNFATGGSFYDTTAAVRGILPGGCAARSL